MKDSTEQDQRITSELGRYRLASPSPGLHDRVLRAARETMTGCDPELHWANRWLRVCRAFQQEILAFASSLMLILGVALQLGGGQSALADSLERLTVMSSVSRNLYSATSMDCTVLIPGARDENPQYRVRWNMDGVTRIDMDSSGNRDQTLWISNELVLVSDDGDTVHSIATTAGPSNWRPCLEFATPMILAQNMEKRYGLMEAERRNGDGPYEFLLVGRKDQQIIEIAIHSETFLPKTLKKYSQDSARTGKERDCIEEVQFKWNKPIPKELLVPGLPAVQRQVN